MDLPGLSAKRAYALLAIDVVPSMPETDTLGKGLHEARFELLATFQAIYRERSVTAAAQSLDKSQPSVSKQLSKLRTWFQDELFVRSAAGMQPTDKAEAMAAGVQRILKEVDALAARQNFRPLTMRGPYVLATTDEVQHFLLPRMLPLLSAQAPNLRLRFRSTTAELSTRELESGAVQSAIVVGGFAADYVRQVFLFSDPLICVMHRHHSLAPGRLTFERYAAAPHLRIAPLGQEIGLVDSLLAKAGTERFVRLAIPNVMDAGAVLMHSDLVATLPTKAAQELAKRHDLVLRKVPLALPKLDYFMCWHERYEQDPAHTWLRRVIGKCSRAPEGSH